MKSEHEHESDYVLERWWHRLLRVLMYVSSFIVLGIAGLVLYYDSSNYTYLYTYSFDPNYELDEGTEQSCSYFESTDKLYCGELNQLNDLMGRYEAVKGSTGGRSDSAPWEKIRSRNEPGPQLSEKQFREQYEAWLAVRQALIEDLDSGRIRFRQYKHWKAGPVAKSVGISVGIAAIWYSLSYVFYKIILYIVYGHTRIRKASA